LIGHSWISLIFASERELLYKNVKEIIRLWKDLYDDGTKQNRNQFKEYDRYLEILNFKNQNKSDIQIAEIVYEDEYKIFAKTARNRCDFQPLLDKVKSNLIAANKLVNGDFKKIS